MDYSHRRGCAQGLHLPVGWKIGKHLHLAEFVYIDNYRSSVEMTSNEAIYDRSCRVPLCWTKVGEPHELELLTVQETVEQMDMLKDWLWEAHKVGGFVQLSAVRIWSYIWVI